ncbi:rhomboid family intramembrane serine protease, partial [Myxococcota bacterium]|nr:rhomboid family intramembrane serine protease [Myxococcota bacterium]
SNAFLALKTTGIFIAILWGIWAIDLINDTLRIFPDITQLGIYPRRLIGLLGIFTSPFIHGGLFHLISNTIPLVFLGFTMLYFYRRTARDAIGIIVVGGGFLVWVFGRHAVHVGASLLIFGMATYLISSGLFRKRIGPIILAILVTLVYGTSLLWGLIPRTGPVSWEGHMSGALAGILAAWLYRKTEY